MLIRPAFRALLRWQFRVRILALVLAQVWELHPAREWTRAGLQALLQERLLSQGRLLQVRQSRPAPSPW
jgi:hypothetical protein